MVLDLTKNQPQEKKEMSFEKVERIGIIAKSNTGWTTELNRISYNGRDPVYDLRTWSPEGKMGKGMTLTDQTLENLLIVLKAHLEGITPEGESGQAEQETESEISAHLPDNF